MTTAKENVAVVGLGYVGLPVAARLAHCGFQVLGFDVKSSRVQELESGVDSTGEVESEALKTPGLRFSSNPCEMSECSFFIVAVPTPIDANRQPDLKYVVAASRTVGSVIKPGACVVFESTVYPGVTEDVCRPIIAEVSGLRAGIDFTVGYSPERINPGDKEHTIEKIVKVVSGEDEETLDRVANVYGSIVEAGIHRASSIKVAESAKVIENTQRDLNIALMNELSIIFNRLGISTRDVLAAAGTKWNFLRFTPGLVGGHCIGVDPYYLTARAEQTGYHPEVILAGRRINDDMGKYIAQELIRILIKQKVDVRSAKVGVFGLTFKENVPDIRNSRTIDIIRELEDFGIQTVSVDPYADAAEVRHEYDLDITEMSEVGQLDAIVLAAPHKQLVESMPDILREKGASVVIDVKSALDRSLIPDGVTYWAL